jgi:hypothetical protein
VFCDTRNDSYGAPRRGRLPVRGTPVTPTAATVVALRSVGLINDQMLAARRADRLHYAHQGLPGGAFGIWPENSAENS